MALEANVTKRLDNKYVQVDITSQYNDPIYYRVPVQRADSFAKKYKELNKRNFFISNISLAAATIAGFSIANNFTKNIKNKFLKYMTDTLFGIGSVILTSNLLGNLNYKQIQNLSKQHGAQQIFYRKNA